MERCDVTVIGGGIVGLAAALQVARSSTARVVVLDKETTLAAHQTGRNSGVMHSGLYYKTGSLKAQNSVRGRALLRDFCDTHGVPYELCGKLVVATEETELPMLDTLERRGAANGLVGVRRISQAELREHEPHAKGLAALIVPETGIVDYRQVCAAYAKELQNLGGEVRLGCRFLELHDVKGERIIKHGKGELSAAALINCAGLQSDRVARACGVDPGLRILPFRGEYYSLKSESAALVRNLIYPVPDPRFPFLGVHFTRRIDGSIEAGPNAVLAFKREGYRTPALSLFDTMSFMSYSGFWLMGMKYWPMAIGEMWRSWSKAAFARALRKLVPEVRSEDLTRAEPGVRAQALNARGQLLDDFCFREAPGQLHVLNAPSPAATASLAIGEQIAERARAHFGLRPR